MLNEILRRSESEIKGRDERRSSQLGETPLSAAVTSWTRPIAIGDAWSSSERAACNVKQRRGNEMRPFTERWNRTVLDL